MPYRLRTFVLCTVLVPLLAGCLGASGPVREGGPADGARKAASSDGECSGMATQALLSWTYPEPNVVPRAGHETFEVPSDAMRLWVNLTTGSQAGTWRLVLTDPLGSIIVEESTPPQVVLGQGNNARSYVLSAPASGVYGLEWSGSGYVAGLRLQATVQECAPPAV